MEGSGRVHVAGQWPVASTMYHVKGRAHSSAREERTLESREYGCRSARVGMQLRGMSCAVCCVLCDKVKAGEAGSAADTAQCALHFATASQQHSSTSPVHHTIPSHPGFSGAA